VLQATGLVYCWGDNRFGQLGYNRTDNLGDGEPVTSFGYVTVGGLATRIAAGGDHTCAILTSGALRCWGYGVNGELGQSFPGLRVFDNSWGDTPDRLPSMLPSDINTGAQVTDVAAGDNHTCALSSDGQLKCWGLGNSGQLGYGDGASQDTPLADGVNLDGVTASQVTAGAAHTCALRGNGSVRCWGAGADGRLGRGSTTDSITATGNVDIEIFAP
jgi:alpha-tubulin suppressor-like RCC1 family protein